MHWLTRLSLYKRWVTILLTIAIVGVSIWATLRIKQEMIPDIDIPMTTLMSVYPLHSSEEVMEKVTEPVENVIRDIGGLKRVSSSSVEGMSFVFAEFEYGTDMNEVNNKIRDGISRIDLPEDMPRTIVNPVTGEEQPNPLLIPLDISMMPVVAYSLSANIDPNELYAIAATEVKPELEPIKGILEKNGVNIDGYREDIVVSPIASKMNASGVPMSQLVNVLMSSHGYDSLDGLRNTPVSPTTMVGQVADVSYGPAPGSAITRTNGQPSVIIYITKSADGNTVEVASAVSAKMRELQEQLPDIEFCKIFDQSDYIKDSISELTRDAVIGGVLAVIVIFIFLLSIRGSLVIAFSIPFSIFVGFLVMSIVGVTINILTLGAMAIAVGRIVDDSIVMLEVIYRRLRQGQSFKQAALEGSKEVAMPIASATLATVAIFVPLAFVGGIVGEMFVPFALTITFAMLSSLVVSLTVVPALSSILVPKQIKAQTGDAWYQRLYTPVLKWSLSHRALTLVIVLVLFVGGLALIPVVGTSFMPPMGEKILIVEVEMPLGTDLGATDNKTAQVEQIIDSMTGDKDSGIEFYYTTVGTSSSFGGAFAVLMGGGGGTNTATIEMLLTKEASLNRVAKDLEKRIVESGLESDECKITVTPMSGGMGQFDPRQFKVFLVGDSYADVAEAAEELVMSLEREVNGLENVESDTTRTISRPRFDINPVKVASFYQSLGLNPIEYSAYFQKEVGLLLTGVELQDKKVDGRAIYVSSIMNTAGPDELGDVLISGGTTSAVKLAGLADSVGFAPSQLNIHRIDGKRSATITATVTKKDVGAVNRAAQEKVDMISADRGVTTRIGGVAEEMNETFRKMAIAIVVAMLISFAIVVVSFRSFLNALLIMVSLPLASIGALIGLLITGHTLGASAMMGMLMLVGIVLTNAIVLLALVDQLRRQGMNTYDALIQGGRTRIRPILMTALTTMIALAPLALGFGEEGVLLASELAIVVLGGLFSSTFLTLIIIPVLYSLTDPIRRRAPVKGTVIAGAPTAGESTEQPK